jgi:starch-binding outer membrane protein, SusD/RagB family
MKKFINKWCLSVVLLLSLGSCTKLDEDLYGRLSPENFYKTDAEVLSALAGVYNALKFGYG